MISYILIPTILLFLIALSFVYKKFLQANLKGKTVLKVSAWDEKLMAFHEAGHTVVFAELFKKNLLETVTIDPNRNGYGSVNFNLNKNLNETYYELIKKIAVALSGRLSEEILLKEVTTSAIHDLNLATYLARDMVLRFGMGKNIKFLQIEEEKINSYSDELKELIEKDIFFILTEATNLAEKTIVENSNTVNKLAKILLSQKTIHKNELNKILD